MSPSDTYYDRIREMKNPYNHRLRLVDLEKGRLLESARRCCASAERPKSQCV